MRKYAISAGHNPLARGAAFGDFNEHDEAVEWQSLICDFLGPEAYRVPTGSLTSKILAINHEKPVAAIEIHFNSSAGMHGKGSEILYCPNSIRGLTLATVIRKHLAPLCLPDRGVKEGWYRMDRPGHVDYYGDQDGDEVVDAFLKRTACPAVILEPFFIHEKDRILAGRYLACQAIAVALREWGETA